MPVKSAAAIANEIILRGYQIAVAEREGNVDFATQERESVVAFLESYLEDFLQEKLAAVGEYGQKFGPISTAHCYLPLGTHLLCKCCGFTFDYNAPQHQQSCPVALLESLMFEGVFVSQDTSRPGSVARNPIGRFDSLTDLVLAISQQAVYEDGVFHNDPRLDNVRLVFDYRFLAPFLEIEARCQKQVAQEVMRAREDRKRLQDAARKENNRSVAMGMLNDLRTDLSDYSYKGMLKQLRAIDVTYAEVMDGELKERRDALAAEVESLKEMERERE